MATMTLKHLDPCPQCENKVYVSIKIKEGLVRDLEDKDPPGTLIFTCTGAPAHRFKMIPGKTLTRLSDLIIKKPRVNKKTSKKTKKTAKDKFSANQKHKKAVLKKTKKHK